MFKKEWKKQSTSKLSTVSTGLSTLGSNYLKQPVTRYSAAKDNWMMKMPSEGQKYKKSRQPKRSGDENKLKR